MTMHAAGTFEVKVIPQGTPDSAEGTVLARMSIDKTFEGELTGSSKGEMLASRTETNGSAAYVAIERVTGTVGGRTGSFVLMHHGTMNAAGQNLRVNVAPGSGTGGLQGIDGTLDIKIVERKHFYEFAYTLPKQPAGQ
jgi:uncharacterized protein DUF3224